tara:strand:- start:497 stop:2206 length:1710 start_codon:yes stop_codon:yes gene_type:complete
MAGMDDIDIFGAPPVTGSTRDRDLDRLESMVRGRYIDPLEQRAKDTVKNQVIQALSGVEGVTGRAIAQVVALADSPDPNDKLVFNQIVSRLNLPINIRRLGDDYMASKRFEGALGRDSSVDISAYRPDEGETQYSLVAQKRFPDFLGKNSSADVSARVSTMGDPEIRARFEKRFANGGEVDIFDETVGQMNRRQQPKDVARLTPAQIANISAAFADPLGMADITGQFPEFPERGVSIEDMISRGERAPSLPENIRQGAFGSAALQMLGVIPLVGGALRSARGLGKAAKGIGSLPARTPASDADLAEQAETLRAIQFGMDVDTPVSTQEVFRSYGKDGVKEIERAFKSNQESIGSAEELVDRAISVNDDFQANMMDIAQIVGGSKAGKFVKQKDGTDFDVEVKTFRSIQDKIDRKNIAPSEFTDGVRTTIYVTSADQASEAARRIGQLYPTLDDGWQRIPNTNYFDRKLNMLITDTSGRPVIGEVQLKTPEMAKAAEPGHRFYEYTRKLEGKYNTEIPLRKIVSYTRAMNQQQRLYADAAKKADPKIREQVIDKFRLGGAVVARYRSFRT